MKNISKLLLLSSATLVPNMLLAAEIVSNEIASTKDWSDTNIWVGKTVPGVNDNVTINLKVVLNFDVNTTTPNTNIKNLTINEASVKDAIFAIAQDLKVDGVLTINALATNSIIRTSANKAGLTVTNSIVATNEGTAERGIFWGNSTPAANTLASLNVGGNIELTGLKMLLNVADTCSVAGTLVLNKKDTNSSIVAFANNTAVAAGSLYRKTSVGAISSADAGSIISAGNTAAQNAHVFLTGIKSATPVVYSGKTADLANGTTSTVGKLSLIMNATNKNFTQTFAGSNAHTGDTVLSKGNLRLNSATTNIGDVYLGYTATSDKVALVKTAIAGAETSIVFVGNGAKTGKFNWSSGELGMNLEGVGENDNVLTVTSLALTSADQYLFDFENAIEGNSYTIMTITNPMGVSVDGINQTTVDQLNSVIAKLKSNYGDNFSYNYTTGKLTFVAGALIVPEPSTYAAIFGALALAFAAYRRRK